MICYICFTSLRSEFTSYHSLFLVDRWLLCLTPSSGLWMLLAEPICWQAKFKPSLQLEKKSFFARIKFINLKKRYRYFSLSNKKKKFWKSLSTWFILFLDFVVLLFIFVLRFTVFWSSMLSSIPFLCNSANISNLKNSWMVLR